MSDSQLRAIRRERDRVPLPKKVSELFGNGNLKSQYVEHRPATRVLDRYHRQHAERAAEAVTEIGIKQAARLPWSANQLSHRHPWAVMWLKGGKRYKKLCTNLWQAVWFMKRLHAAGMKNATVVSRGRSYHIPVELVGRLPRPWVWCPHCMKPRKFRRVGDQTIYAQKKVETVDRKGRTIYEYRERKVALLACPMCGCTNRNQVFRQSNQPFHRRKFKQGATRARRTSKLGSQIKRRR